MTYTFREHLKIMLTGVIAGLLSGVFLALVDVWKLHGWWGLWVPLFVLIIYFIIAVLVTYGVFKKWEEKDSKGKLEIDTEETTKKKKIFNSEKLFGIIAIFISLSSVIIAWNVAYGDADLETKYVLGEQGIFYLYKTNDASKQDVVVQFIIRNKGYGSTIYTVDAVTCMNPPNCLPESFGLPIIRYNEEREYQAIAGPDFHSINPKSSDFVEIVYTNISKEELPEFFDVRIQDYISSKELWMRFYKSPISHDFIYEIFNNTGENEIN